MELITSSSPVNAYILHKSITGLKSSIIKFKEIVAVKLLHIQQAARNIERNVAESKSWSSRQRFLQKSKKCVSEIIRKTRSGKSFKVCKNYKYFGVNFVLEETLDEVIEVINKEEKTTILLNGLVWDQSVCYKH